MPRRTLWAGIALMIAVGLGAFLLSRAPTTTTSQPNPCLTQGTTCLRLPTVSGANLLNQPQTFPADFAAPYNLVVMSFDRDQQVRALEFVPLLQRLSAAYPSVTYYSIAALPDLSAPVRLLVTGGMNAAVTETTLRQQTSILYLEDQAAFLAALDLPDTSQIQVLLFNQAGEVLWRQGGDYTPALDAALTAVLAQWVAAK
jgi:hypothetical protein